MWIFFPTAHKAKHLITSLSHITPLWWLWQKISPSIQNCQKLHCTQTRNHFDVSFILIIIEIEISSMSFLPVFNDTSFSVSFICCLHLAHASLFMSIYWFFALWKILRSLLNAAPLHQTNWWLWISQLLVVIYRRFTLYSTMYKWNDSYSSSGTVSIHHISTPT